MSDQEVTLFFVYLLGALIGLLALLGILEWALAWWRSRR